MIAPDSTRRCGCHGRSSRPGVLPVTIRLASAAAAFPILAGLLAVAYGISIRDWS